jgi:CheY-like chemotaxis protein
MADSLVTILVCPGPPGGPKAGVLPVSAVGMVCTRCSGLHGWRASHPSARDRPRRERPDGHPLPLGIVRYTCETAADGRSGLVRFDEGGWDLVITDLAMPEMSGWDVIEAIRHRVPTMPILVVTAFNDLTVIQKAREWQVPVIGKPFRLETLKTAVIQALAPTKREP